MTNRNWRYFPKKSTKNNDNPWYIYVLKCAENKWYVGKSRTPKKRIKDHMNPGKSKGCQWTRLYPAIETILLELGDSKDENYWTIELAKEHGIENVRGGDWAQPVLSDRRKKILLDRISDSEE